MSLIIDPWMLWQPGINAGTPLWTSRLDGTISLGTPDYVPPGVPTTPYYFRSDWSGSDSRGNGKPELQTALQSNVLQQMYYTIVTPNDVGSPPTLADRSAVWDFAIAPSDFSGGVGNKLVMTQKIRSWPEWDGFRPQAANIFTRTQNIQLYDLCVRKKIRIPANMADVLSGSPGLGWCEFDAIKCSHDIGTTVDFRFSFQMAKKSGESGLRFMAQLDRGTGGTPVDIYPLYSPEGSCNPGDDYQMEYFISRPRTGGNTNLVDGVFQFVMTNLRTKEKHVVVNAKGGIFFGVNNGQMSLFYHYLMYTGGFPTTGQFVLEVADLEYWSTPPAPLV